ncbi:hypothetical protein H0H93_007693 [Arthromyces matolae]|nr:hypothetical protein H0H93_007693 [Arthromyces matolae]
MQINLPTCLAMYALGLSVVMTAALPLPGHDCPLCAKLEVKPMTSNFCEVCWDYPVFEAPPHAEPYSSTDHQSEHFAMGTSLQFPGPGLPQTLPGQHYTEPPPHSQHDHLATSASISQPSHSNMRSSKPYQTFAVAPISHEVYGSFPGLGSPQASTGQQYTGPPAHSQYGQPVTNTPFPSSTISQPSQPLREHMGSSTPLYQPFVFGPSSHPSFLPTPHGIPTSDSHQPQTAPTPQRGVQKADDKKLSDSIRNTRNHRIARDFYHKYLAMLKGENPENSREEEMGKLQRYFNPGGRNTDYDKIVRVAREKGIKLKGSFEMADGRLLNWW